MITFLFKVLFDIELTKNFYVTEQNDPDTENGRTNFKQQEAPSDDNKVLKEENEEDEEQKGVLQRETEDLEISGGWGGRRGDFIVNFKIEVEVKKKRISRLVWERLRLYEINYNSCNYY